MFAQYCARLRMLGISAIHHLRRFTENCTILQQNFSRPVESDREKFSTFVRALLSCARGMSQMGLRRRGYGFSCLPTRDKASKLKRRAPRKHFLPSLFYGNGGTKFPKLTTGDGSGIVALFCMPQRAFQLTCVQVELLVGRALRQGAE